MGRVGSVRCADQTPQRGVTTMKKKKEARSSTTWPLCAKLTADSKFGCRIYFPYVVGAGATTSLCCAQAPSPKAVTSTATIMIAFKNFILLRLLSERVAALF